MSKQKKWKDVRLVFFDLQTVEFTYAEVHFLLLLADANALTSIIGLHRFNILSRPPIS